MATEPKPSKGVTSAIDADYTPLADGLAAIMWFTYHTGRARDHGPYRLINLRAGERRIEVCISPTGRSVQVYVDGEKV
jgi:hypothetical protein